MLYRIAVIFVWLLLLSGLIPAQVSGLAPQSGLQPTPLPVNSLHQWGAVTLFHGLPSDRVNAIAQTPDGALWFGTDGGLARYDGRRTQTINAAGLPTGRVLALQADAVFVDREGGKRIRCFPVAWLLRVKQGSYVHAFSCMICVQ